ncbi:MAG: hypothetical protein PHG07_08045 [Lachnospiraceae bacterium]|nr:hypothetical protein [Lachnospiraceae bacterium]
MFEKSYVVTFDKRTKVMVDAKNKKQARELASKFKTFKKESMLGYTTNEVTSIHTFWFDFFFGKRNM